MAEDHQLVTVDEEEERPERKRRRTDSVEEESSLFFFDRRGSPGETEKVQDQTAVPLYERGIEGKSNNLVIIIIIIKKCP